MGIPLESAKSSSDDNFDEPRLPNTAGKVRKSKSSLTAKQSQKKIWQPRFRLYWLLLK